MVRDGAWANATATYRGWPRWARIAVPITAVVVLLAVVASVTATEEVETAGRDELTDTTEGDITTTTQPAPTSTAPPTTTTTVPPPTTTAPPPPAPAPAPAPPPPPAPDPGGSCHPSYTPCVPIAYDVDCGGGSGDGPAYVDGPVSVIGPDQYDLDRDGDGVACE